MVWSLTVLGLAGILLGLSFRVPALIAATFLTALACLAHDVAAGVFGWRTLPLTLGMIVTLQVTYMIGLFAGVMWRRRRAPDT